MSRNARTIEGLLQEYTHGLNGSPSIKSLDLAYGPKWRVDRTENKFYSRRKPIFDEYDRLLASGLSERDAVGQLKTTMLEVGNSLDALQKKLRST
jgi:hypothetical protein